MIDKRIPDCDRSRFTLDRPITYQIKIAGQVSENWADCPDRMDILIEMEASGLPTTTLTGSVDQAALIGLLRQLYYRGFPLISVNCLPSRPG